MALHNEKSVNNEYAEESHNFTQVAKIILKKQLKIYVLFAYLISFLFLIWYINIYYIQILEQESSNIFVSGIIVSSMDFFSFMLAGIFTSKFDVFRAQLLQIAFCMIVNIL